MSLDGTLCDEVVRRGVAKLIMPQTFSAVSGVVFSLPLSHEAFLFSVDNLFFSDTANGMLCMRLSRNGGLAWDTSYAWAMLTLYANFAQQFHVSPDVDTSCLRVGGFNDTLGHMLSGHIKFYRNLSGGVEHVISQMESWGTYPFNNWCNGFGQQGSGVNAVYFFATAGTMTGRINLYGMKKL